MEFPYWHISGNIYTDLVVSEVGPYRLDSGPVEMLSDLKL